MEKAKQMAGIERAKELFMTQTETVQSESQIDPVCGMKVLACEGCGFSGACGDDVVLLREGMPGEV